MSVHVSAWAWRQKVEDASAKLVLVKLADNANDEGIAWPSRKTIADETELSLRTLVRKVQYLEEKGLVDVQRRWRSSNVYRLRCHGVTS